MMPTSPSSLPLQRRSRRLAPLLAAAALACAPSSAHAQSSAPESPALLLSQPVPEPGKPLASTDDLASMVVNPANLAWLPSWEVRGTFAYAGDEATRPMRGGSVAVGAPLWLLAGGLRLDVMAPPASTPLPFAGPSGWLRFGLAAREGDTLAFGTTVAVSFADDPLQNGVVSVTSGLSFRPSSIFALSAVARDWNRPQSNGGVVAGRVFEAGAAIRPFGTRVAELGLEAQYHAETDDWVPRATLGIDLPRFGRLRGDVALLDPAGLRYADGAPRWLASAVLDVTYDRYQSSAGTFFGDGLSPSPTAGFFGAASWRGHREAGLPQPSRYVRLTFRSTPGVRSHVRLLRRLWKLATEPEVDGVVLVMQGGEPAGSLAHAEEVADALALVRSSGKKVVCHLEDSAGRALYACAGADRIAMNPAGGLRFSGLSSQYFYFGGLLERLGVRADFVRIGAHKLAAEQFTLRESSDVGKSDHAELVGELERTFLHDVGAGRKLAPADLQARLAKGPFVAREAREAGLVDVLAFPDELGRVLEEVAGKRVRLADDPTSPRAPERWQPAPHVCVVYLHGDMVDGESQVIPFLGIRLAGSRTVSRALQRCREDRDARAVVFRIETGGGSSLAADVILREAQLTAKAKPLVVSMGTAAASGGYYAAMAGKPVFANRATITGSIGIFYGKVDFQEMLRGLGVTVEGVRSAPRADAESLYRPFTDDERRELGKKVKGFYDVFVGRVVEGRGLTAGAVDAVARGKVWTGEQALVHKLVDRVGGLRQALAEARRLGGLPDDAPLVELPDDDESLFGFLLKQLGIRLSAGGPAALVIPPGVLELARALAPFWIHGESVPLARLAVGELGSDAGSDTDDVDARTFEAALGAPTPRGLVRP
jgi:protease-4